MSGWSGASSGSWAHAEAQRQRQTTAIANGMRRIRPPCGLRMIWFSEWRGSDGGGRAARWMRATGGDREGDRGAMRGSLAHGWFVAAYDESRYSMKVRA